jgi:hypothetical protein
LPLVEVMSRSDHNPIQLRRRSLDWRTEWNAIPHVNQPLTLKSSNRQQNLERDHPTSRSIAHVDCAGHSMMNSRPTQRPRPASCNPPPTRLKSVQRWAMGVTCVSRCFLARAYAATTKGLNFVLTLAISRQNDSWVLNQSANESLNSS